MRMHKQWFAVAATLSVGIALFMLTACGGEPIDAEEPGPDTNGITEHGVKYGPWAEDDPVRQAIMRGEITAEDLMREWEAENADQEKTFVRTGHGMYDSGAPASRCANLPATTTGGWPPSGHTCGIQHDKKVRFKYTGTIDDQPGWVMSAKVAFQNAAANFCADLNGSPGGYDCGTTTGSSNEPTFNGALSGSAIGLTTHVDCGNRPEDYVINPNTGVTGYIKCHGCTVRVDKAKLAALYPQTGQGQIAMQNTFYHEMAHCEALGHLSTSGYVMHPMLQSATSILRLDFADKERFGGYVP